MTTIHARLRFRFPFRLAREYLREGLAQVSQSGPQRLLLTAHVPATAILLSKEALIECAPDSENPENTENTDTRWRIHWTPEPGGLYPSFDGKLWAGADEDDGKTILELEGEYTPPLEAAGRAFDRVLGHKIAEDTAHEVLADIAAEMKVHYAYEEARHAYDETAEQPEDAPEWRDLRF